MTLESAFNNVQKSAKGSESKDNFAGLFDDIDVNNKTGIAIEKRNDKFVKLKDGVSICNQDSLFNTI